MDDRPDPSRPVDGALWQTWQRRIAKVFVAFGLVLLAETLVVNSPAFLAEAMFRGHEVGLHTLRHIPDSEREAFLVKQCWMMTYYMQGLTRDPSGIPGPETCTPSGMVPFNPTPPW